MIEPYSVHFLLRNALRSACRLIMIGALSGCLVLSACKEKSAEPQDNVDLIESAPPTSAEVYRDSIAKSDFTSARSVLDRDGESVSTSVGVPLNDLYRDVGRRLANSGQIDLALSLFNNRATASDALAMIWRNGLAAKKAGEPSRSEFLILQTNGIRADLSSKSWDRLEARLGVLDLLAPFEEELELLVARSSIDLALSGAQPPLEAINGLERATKHLTVLVNRGNTEAVALLESLPSAQDAVRLNVIYLPALQLYTDKKYSKSSKLLRLGHERLPTNAGLDQLYGQALFSHATNSDLSVEDKAALLQNARDVFTAIDSVEFPDVLIWLDVVDQTILTDLIAPTVEEGRQLFVKPDYEAAIPLFERVLEIDPTSISGKHLLSQSLVLYARGRSGPEAIDALDRADVLMAELVEAGQNVDVYQEFSRYERERLALEPVMAPAQAAYDAQQYAEAIIFLEDVRRANKSNLIEQLYVQSLILRAAQPDIDIKSARQLFERAERLLLSRPESDSAIVQVWLDVLLDRRTTFEMNTELDDVKALSAKQDYTGALDRLASLEQKYPDNPVLLDWKQIVLAGMGSDASLREAFGIIVEADQAESGSADRWIGIATRGAKSFMSGPWLGEIFGKDFSVHLMNKIGGGLLTDGALSQEQILGHRMIFRAAQSQGIEASEVLQSLNVAGRTAADCNTAVAIYRAEARELKRLDGQPTTAPLCPPDGSKTQIESALVSSYALVREIEARGGLMDLFDPSIDRASRSGVTLVPPQFDKPFSIVSDGDSQRVGEVTTQTGYMQDVLGLPIATSVFVVDNIDFGNAPVEFRSTALSNSLAKHDGNMLDVPVAFNVVRDWYLGRADHLHGWSQGRVVAQHYFAEPVSLISSQVIDFETLFETAENRSDVDALYQGAAYPNQWRRSRHSVLRLLLDGPLPRDAQVRLANGEQWVAYDVNGLQSVSKVFTENGRSLTIVELPAYPRNGSLVAHDDVKGATTDYALTVASDDCDNERGTNCDVTLLGLDFDTEGRASIERTGAWVRAFGLTPVLYTAHGGDRMSSFGIVENVDYELGQTYISRGKALAGQPNSKGYIADIVSDIGIRGIRGFSSARTQHVMRPFPLMSETFREFGNFANFQTQWVPDPEPNDGILPDIIDAQAKTFQGLADLGPCNFALEGYLPAYIETSLRSDLSNDPTGEVWYTHFSAKCEGAPAVSDTIGFSAMTRDALISLARRSYGLSTPEEIATFPNRLWNVPPSTIYRTRILDQELSVGGLEIVSGKDGSTSQILSKPSLFFNGERFPRPELTTRDLNGLTIDVKPTELANFSLRVDDTPLPAIVKTKIGSGSAVKAYATILDLSEATPLADPLDLSSPKATWEADRLNVSAGKVCLKAERGTPLRNVSAIGFSLDSRREAQSLALEFVFKDRSGSVVFVSKDANYTYREGPSTIYEFEADLATLNQDSWRYLLPTWEISDVQGEPAGPMPAFMAGDLMEVCVHSKTAVTLEGFTAYHYATQNRRPGRQLTVGGRIESGSQGDLVTLTANDRAPVYSTVDADGQWFASISVDGGTPYDEAPEPIKLTLLAERLTDMGTLTAIDSRSVSLQRSRFDLDVGDVE